MKLVFLLVCLIVGNAVDCSGQASTIEPPAPPLTYSPWTSDAERMVEEDSEYGEAYERSTCKLKNDCGFWGGTCTTNSTACIGRVVAKGCKGSGCMCCIPGCPEKMGFFSPPGSRQCFKVDFRGREVNYVTAKSNCAKLGLKLAHPEDAVGLRSTIMQLYGLSDEVWLAAQATGSQFVWSNGYALRNTSAMWAPNQPRSTTSSYCLALGTYGTQWENYPDQPFYSQSCTIPEYAVCEKV